MLFCEYKGDEQTSAKCAADLHLCFFITWLNELDIHWTCTALCGKKGSMLLHVVLCEAVC